MGSEPRLPLGGEDSLDISSILGDPRQRRLLAILLEQSHPLTARDLSVQVAAQEAGTAPSDVPEADHHSIQVDLQHRCLPKLDAVGWIEQHAEGVIATEALSVWDSEPMLPDLQVPDHPFWEAVAALLARPRRQALVSIMAGQRHCLTLEELATELVEDGPASWAPEQSDDEPTLCSTLHHVDLPRLAEVGLIEYDSDEKTISRTNALMTFVNRMEIDNRGAEGTATD